MKLTHKIEDGILNIKPQDKAMDADIPEALREKFLSYISKGRRKVLLDLSRVERMESSGLGLILSALKLLNGKGRMVIAGADEKLTDLFHIVRLDKVVNFFETKKEALKALHKSKSIKPKKRKIKGK